MKQYDMRKSLVSLAWGIAIAILPIITLALDDVHTENKVVAVLAACGVAAMKIILDWLTHNVPKEGQ